MDEDENEEGGQVAVQSPVTTQVTQPLTTQPLTTQPVVTQQQPQQTTSTLPLNETLPLNQTLPLNE